MPAWPAQQRDDEVWAIVAFLRRMPRLGPGDFRRLADGRDDAARFAAAGDAPPAVRDVCARCHGEDGTGRVPGAFPSLAGQRAEYLYQSLRAFANRRRISGTMTEVASKCRNGQMRVVATDCEAVRPPRGDS